MQGSPRMAEALNEALTAELTAINQYFVASKLAANWGYGRLAKEFYDESLGEMRHAEALIERILFLEGHPNLQRLGTVMVGESVVEQFRLNHQMETAAVERYRQFIVLASEEGDPGSRTLLEGFLREEEHHVDQAEAELANLEQLGEQLWLAKWV